MSMESKLSRLVRIGTVSNVDDKKRQARVKFHDTGEPSGWLRVLQHYGAGVYVVPDAEHTHNISDTYTNGGSASTFPSHDHPGTHVTYWMPKMDDAVLVLYIPVADGDGYILGGV